MVGADDGQQGISELINEAYRNGYNAGYQQGYIEGSRDTEKEEYIKSVVDEISKKVGIEADKELVKHVVLEPGPAHCGGMKVPIKEKSEDKGSLHMDVHYDLSTRELSMSDPKRDDHDK